MDAVSWAVVKVWVVDGCNICNCYTPLGPGWEKRLQGESHVALHCLSALQYLCVSWQSDQKPTKWTQAFNCCQLIQGCEYHLQSLFMVC